MSNNLEVQTRKIDEKAIIIDLVGDVNSDGDTLIKDAYRKAVAEGAQTVAFDMTRTDYINTSGISVLISVVMEAKKANQKVLVYGVSPHYKKVFDLVRFSVYVTMFDDETSARASLTTAAPQATPSPLPPPATATVPAATEVPKTAEVPAVPQVPTATETVEHQASTPASPSQPLP
ncbi:MAG: STAS domain-containing protein [Chloroflexota bacterium]|nr:STAS domain-containing protein [Chloroflexota bacterium]